MTHGAGLLILILIFLLLFPFVFSEPCARRGATATAHSMRWYMRPRAVDRETCVNPSLPLLLQYRVEFGLDARLVEVRLEEQCYHEHLPCHAPLSEFLVQAMRPTRATRAQTHAQQAHSADGPPHRRHGTRVAAQSSRGRASCRSAAVSVTDADHAGDAPHRSRETASRRCRRRRTSCRRVPPK